LKEELIPNCIIYTAGGYEGICVESSKNLHSLPEFSGRGFDEMRVHDPLELRVPEKWVRAAHQ
jgi:hypothetical protein